MTFGWGGWEVTRSQGWSLRCGLRVLVKRPQRTSLPSLPCGDTARRQPSVSQEVGSHQTAGLRHLSQEHEASRAGWSRGLLLTSLLPSSLHLVRVAKGTKTRGVSFPVTSPQMTLARLGLAPPSSHLPRPAGFPGGANGKEPACQCRRHQRCRFDPWVRKIPWRRA